MFTSFEDLWTKVANSELLVCCVAWTSLASMVPQKTRSAVLLADGSVVQSHDAVQDGGVLAARNLAYDCEFELLEEE